MIRPQRLRHVRPWQATALVAALACAQPGLAQDDLEVSFSEDQGTVRLHAEAVPLGEVLAALGEAANVELIEHARQDAPVTVDLVDLPVKTVFERLLGRSNYTMMADPETGRPIRVWLMSSADLEAIARIREAQRITTETERAKTAAQAQRKADFSQLSDQLRAELRELGEGGSEYEVLERLGLTPAEQEELLWILGEIEASKPPTEP